MFFFQTVRQTPSTVVQWLPASVSFTFQMSVSCTWGANVTIVSENRMFWIHFDLFYSQECLSFCVSGDIYLGNINFIPLMWKEIHSTCLLCSRINVNVKFVCLFTSKLYRISYPLIWSSRRILILILHKSQQVWSGSEHL